MTAFATVVIQHAHDPEWEKLDAIHPLSEFHRMFWGTSMEEEAKRWLDTQTSIHGPAQGSAENDHDMAARNSVEDEDVGEPIKQDFVEGCYVLDLNIKRIPVPKLWVRSEYIKSYDFAEFHYEDSMRFGGSPPSLVLTGQPGIGKSVWIYYALRRRLAQKKSVIWYRLGECYLFVEEGVFMMPQRFSLSEFHSVVWTLVDSDETTAFPAHLVAHGSRLFVIFATSPAKDRWSCLHKTTRSATFVMNPWTRREIFHVARIMSPNLQPARVGEVFDKYGPIPRLCFDYLNQPHLFSEYLEELANAIGAMSPERLQKLVLDARAFRMDELSHKICLIARRDIENISGGIVLTPITPFIGAKLAIQFRHAQKAEQRRLYDTFSRVPQSRPMAGIMYEPMIQRRLLEGIILTVVPMIKLDASRSGSLPQWHSCHMPLNNVTLEAHRLLSLLQTFTVEIKPTRVEEYENDGLNVIQPGVLYIPAVSNYVALDSFILLGGFLYIFQITIAEQHDVGEGLVDVLEGKDNVPPYDKWRFVMIIPPDVPLKIRQPRSRPLRGLAPYSAVINPLSQGGN